MNEILKNFLNDKDIKNIFNSYIYEFMHMISKSKKLNNKTIYINIKYIEMFDRYLYYFYPNATVTDINEYHVEMYKDFCVHQLKNTNKTINKKLKALNRFFSHLTDKGLYQYNFMLNIRHLKNEEEHSPTIMSTSEIRILFSQMRQYIYGIRDVCICKLILQTGLNIHDILNICLDHISLSEKTIFITLKNKEKKIYSLSDSLMNELYNYLELRTTFDSNCSPYLFLSKRGNKYSIRSYQMFFDEAVRRCDFKIAYTPRNLRSTFLYNMSLLVEDSKLQEIAGQQTVKQYYELHLNPLRNII
ncbi:tyrosine-type recombinase/integrase [Clostridium butyricum]|uniref:tyrosine-type recombinase/integrase n=1 Tax=Clostridium butyricum TaxID=1492 RepID=UPI002AAFBE79|nr:tyrosine-type recombinase/integrase [Clostridium butyricum]